MADWAHPKRPTQEKCRPSPCRHQVYLLNMRFSCLHSSTLSFPLAFSCTHSAHWGANEAKCQSPGAWWALRVRLHKSEYICFIAIKQTKRCHTVRVSRCLGLNVKEAEFSRRRKSWFKSYTVLKTEVRIKPGTLELRGGDATCRPTVLPIFAELIEVMNWKLMEKGCRLSAKLSANAIVHFLTDKTCIELLFPFV